MGRLSKSRAACLGVALFLGITGATSAQAAVQESYPVTAAQASTVNTVVTGGTDTTSSTVQNGEPGKCGSRTLTRTVWTRFKGTGGPVLVDTGDSNFDTIAIVYAANGDGTPGAHIKCNDDISDSVYQSAVSVDTEAGADYLVQVGGCYQCDNGNGGFTTSSGTLVLTLLGNDKRANAEPIPAGQTLTRTNYWATSDDGENVSCNGVNYGSTVWFKFSSPAPGTATFVVAHAHTVMAVYKGGSGAFEKCLSSTSDNSTLRHTMPVGTGDYLIQVGGHDGHESPAIALSVEYTENRDLDGDKYDKSPGPDCDDSNAAINPGAKDIPHNGINEDCVAGDNLDGDGDGHAKAPPGDDCDDTNHAIHPGAVERLGDFVDENCDRTAAPNSIAADITFPAIAVPGGRRFNPLVVKNVKPGYRVRVRCRGSRRCPRLRTVTARSKRAITFKAFRNRVLASGRVEVFITVPGKNTIGYYKSYSMRGTRKPKTRICDLHPKAPSKPVRCR